MDQKRLNLLFEKYQQGTLSTLEQEELNEWFHKLNLGSTEFETWIAQAGGEENYIENRLANLKIRLTQLQPVAKTYRLWPRIAAAASILLFLSIGGYYILHKPVLPQTAQNQIHNDVAPGGNKAILTLSDNKQIILSDAKNGVISKEGNQLVKKANDGTLSYEGSSMSGKDQPLKYNTVTTPRGGQWPLILPDGTKVMLDAASSIKYPVSFASNERRVEITGQVYFEVVHHAKLPFRVKVNNQIIEDLGTHFNINAYTDEPASRVTLLEGSVKVSIGPRVAVLKPGQEAVMVNGINTIKVKKVDADEAIAWKTGRFFFKQANIQTVMRQLSRWYDVQISYRGKMPQHLFNGDIQRSLKASQILDVLSNYYNIPFKIEGKSIVVGE